MHIEQNQLVFSKLKEEFPSNQVKQREGPKKKMPNGRWEPVMFNYIPEPYVRERLDTVLPLAWDWTVLTEKEYSVVKSKYNKDTNQSTDIEVKQVVVRGRLTLHLADGFCVHREAFGGSDLEKGSQAGDPYKIASSNAFKKAAYMFGVGAYLGLVDDADTDAVASTGPRMTAPVTSSPSFTKPSSFRKS